MNFLKLSIHVFCLAEKAKLCRINSKTNCQQNKITICLATTDVSPDLGELVKIIDDVNVIEAVEPFKLHPTSMSYIYKVFEHLKQLWMGI